MAGITAAQRGIAYGGIGILAALAMCLQSAPAVVAAGRETEDLSRWTIYVTNDNCPDYTWGYTEEQTRKSFADIVRGHLDEMTRTDDEEPGNRDRYNMAVTQEAMCFVEHYPQRKDELIRRIKEGRVFVSPYLCNSLWAFGSVEGAIRTFYPARRLEREWGIATDVAEHIELPSLPWGMAPILEGCGIRWLSNPYYGYDSTFGGLKNPPLFIFEGPDGSQVRVVMDAWASGRASYTQGGNILANTGAITKEWIPHYAGLGKGHGIKAILASGTHGDISPGSGGQARGFAEAIMKYNASNGAHPRLVNATLRQFCEEADRAEAARAFMATIRGSFGHSWDVWPVSLAKYAADMREGERTFLAAEALLAAGGRGRRDIQESTRKERERAEWCWAMLSDHAWNGTDERNKRHNAELRRKWSEELRRIGEGLLERGWSAAGLEAGKERVTIFNSLSVRRRGLVRIERPEGIKGVVAEGRNLKCQIETEDGREVLYFVCPEVGGFGFRRLDLTSEGESGANELRATATELEGPCYRLRVDMQTGGIASIIHKPSGTELVVPGTGRGLCETTYFAGEAHSLKDIRTEIVADGPVLARLRIRGRAEGIEVSNYVTVYAELDQVDFDVRVDKAISTAEERLCQVFPVMRDGAVLRIEETGAVIRPKGRGEGDLLSGADARRFAVQGFVDASTAAGIGVSIAPLDAFVLRLDLKPLTFEAVGNDQNYREVVRDQDGVRSFRFRYALRGHSGGYKNSEVFAWSRGAGYPLVAALGGLRELVGPGSGIEVDARRAIATCLKPADEDGRGMVLRLWETAGRSEPIAVGVAGYGKAFLTDLLERDKGELEVSGGEVRVPTRAYGFCSLRLAP